MDLEIDGAMGEGGGQVVRSTLAFSLLTGTPVRIVRVRDGREKGGLRHQHVAAIRAAAVIGRANVTGDAVGSREIVFRPHAVEGGKYVFDVGTAGSATLVFQTVVLPLLLRAARPSTIVFRGGTANPMAPPFFFLERVYVPLLRSLGADLSVALRTHGLYPRGGGAFEAHVAPSRLGPLSLLQRGDAVAHEARFLVAGLRRSIAEREESTYAAAFAGTTPTVRTSIDDVGSATGPGNLAMAYLGHAGANEVVTRFGERGVSAEKVAALLADDVRAFLTSGVPVSEHLADQLVFPLAFGSGGTFFTGPLSLHTRTQIDLLAHVTGVRVTTTPIGTNVIVEVPPLDCTR